MQRYEDELIKTAAGWRIYFRALVTTVIYLPPGNSLLHDMWLIWSAIGLKWKSQNCLYWLGMRSAALQSFLFMHPVLVWTLLATTDYLQTCSIETSGVYLWHLFLVGMEYTRSPITSKTRAKQSQATWMPKYAHRCFVNTKILGPGLRRQSLLSIISMTGKGEPAV